MTEIEHPDQESSSEVKKDKSPFQWGDENKTNADEVDPVDEGQSFTSIADLLDAELDIELKRLAEYFKKHPPVDSKK